MPSHSLTPLTVMPQTGPAAVCTVVPAAHAGGCAGAARADVAAWTPTPVPAVRITAPTAVPSSRDRRGMNRIARMRVSFFPCFFRLVRPEEAAQLAAAMPSSRDRREGRPGGRGAASASTAVTDGEGCRPMVRGQYRPHLGSAGVLVGWAGQYRRAPRLGTLTAGRSHLPAGSRCGPLTARRAGRPCGCRRGRPGPRAPGAEARPGAMSGVRKRGSSRAGYCCGRCRGECTVPWPW
jgi:hypothetical protein